MGDRRLEGSAQLEERRWGGGGGAGGTGVGAEQPGLFSQGGVGGWKRGGGGCLKCTVSARYIKAEGGRLDSLLVASRKDSGE